MSKHLRLGSVCFLFILLISSLSYAAEQEYPNRSVSLIVTTPPGGISDLAARALGDLLSEQWRQPVVTVNKPGGGNMIGGNAVVAAKPDGYTMGMFNVMVAVPEAFLYFQEASFSSKDLKPACRIGTFMSTIVVKRDAPWNNFKDLVEYVRKNPGTNFGIASPAGGANLMKLTIEKKEGIKLTGVPHAGDNDQVVAVLGGHIPIGCISYSAGKAQIDAGNLKVLAFLGEERFEMMPQVPTTSEMGYHLCYSFSVGLFLPKDTPDIIVQKISETSKKVTENAQFRQKSNNIGFQPAYLNTEQYKSILERDKVNVGNCLNEWGYVKK